VKATPKLVALFTLALSGAALGQTSAAPLNKICGNGVLDAGEACDFGIAYKESEDPFARKRCSSRCTIALELNHYAKTWVMRQGLLEHKRHTKYDSRRRVVWQSTLDIDRKKGRKIERVVETVYDPALDLDARFTHAKLVEERQLDQRLNTFHKAIEGMPFRRDKFLHAQGSENHLRQILNPKDELLFEVAYLFKKKRLAKIFFRSFENKKIVVDEVAEHHVNVPLRKIELTNIPLHPAMPIEKDPKDFDLNAFGKLSRRFDTYFEYDKSRRLIRRYIRGPQDQEPRSETRFQYNERGQLATKTYESPSDKGEVRYEYDSRANNVRTYKSGTLGKSDLRCEYNKEGLLTLHVNKDDEIVTHFEYDHDLIKYNLSKALVTPTRRSYWSHHRPQHRNNSRGLSMSSERCASLKRSIQT